MLNKCGVATPTNPLPPVVFAPRNPNVLSIMQQAAQRAQQAFKQPPRLLLVVLPDTGGLLFFVVGGGFGGGGPVWGAGGVGRNGGLCLLLTVHSAKFGVSITVAKSGLTAQQAGHPALRRSQPPTAFLCCCLAGLMPDHHRHHPTPPHPTPPTPPHPGAPQPTPPHPHALRLDRRRAVQGGEAGHGQHAGHTLPVHRGAQGRRRLAAARQAAVLVGK